MASTGIKVSIMNEKLSLLKDIQIGIPNTNWWWTDLRELKSCCLEYILKKLKVSKNEATMQFTPITFIYTLVFMPIE